MQKDLLIKFGSRIEIKSMPKCRVPAVSIALAKEGIKNTFDNQFLYVMEDIEIPKVAERINNRIWMQKIARHRIYEDCKGCKFLDEESHLGKMWCNKWDTDIWNVSTPFPEDKNTVNKGCVPFRYFGLSPANPMRPSHYGFEKNAMATDKDVIKKFIEMRGLDEIGIFVDENTFVGEFTPTDRFGIRFNPRKNKIELSIEKGVNKEKEIHDYEPTEKSIPEIDHDWQHGWGFGYAQSELINKKTESNADFFKFEIGDKVKIIPYKDRDPLEYDWEVDPNEVDTEIYQIVKQDKRGDKNVYTILHGDNNYNVIAENNLIKVDSSEKTIQASLNKKADKEIKEITTERFREMVDNNEWFVGALREDIIGTWDFNWVMQKDFSPKIVVLEENKYNLDYPIIDTYKGFVLMDAGRWTESLKKKEQTLP